MSETAPEIEDSQALASADPVIPDFRRWAILKFQSNKLSAELNHLRDRIITAVAERGYTDHKGSQYIDLPFPIQAGDTSYSRIKRERRVSVVVDHEAAADITSAHRCYDRAFPPVPTLDADELYVLYQEGVLTSEEMDRIFLQRESWAFRGMP